MLRLFIPASIMSLVFAIGLRLNVAHAHDFGWRVSTPSHISIDDSYGTFNNAAVQAMVADYSGNSNLTMYNEGFTYPYSHLKITTTWQRNIDPRKVAVAIPFAYPPPPGPWKAVPCASSFDGALTDYCGEGYTVAYGLVRINMRYERLVALRQITGYDQFLVTHETGHLLGLKHPTCPFGPYGSVSVMNQGQCMLGLVWNSLVWTLQGHDKSDLNGMYP